MFPTAEDTVEIPHKHLHKHRMLRCLWRPNALKIDLVDFCQAIPDGIPAVLLYIIDRLEPQDHLKEYFKEYYPMYFDDSMQPYVQYLLNNDIAMQGADKHLFEAADPYQNGDYYQLSLTTQLSDTITEMLDAAEVSTGKVVIGKIASDYTGYLW